MTADLSLRDPNLAVDTLVITGVYELRDVEAILAIPDVNAWLRRSARQSRRVVSICTGS